MGRFIGEDKKLVFAPPHWYDGLVMICLVGGALVAASGLFVRWLDGFGLPEWRLWTGIAVVLAGVWAALSNERMTCDLRARTFHRLEGKGPLKRWTRGRLNDLDAVVLLSEAKILPTGPVVVYRIVLHWKGSRMPLLVVGQSLHSLAAGASLNHMAGPMAALAHRYSSVLGLPFFDNAHFHSPEPLRPL